MKFIFSPNKHRLTDEEWGLIKSFIATSLYNATLELIEQRGKDVLKEVFFFANKRSYCSPYGQEHALDWMNHLMGSRDEAVDYFCKEWGNWIIIPFQNGMTGYSELYQDHSFKFKQQEFLETTFEVTNENIAYILYHILESLATGGGYGSFKRIAGANLIMPKTATTLSQEAINFLRRANDCYF